MHTDEQEIPTAEYLRDLSERLRHVPAMYGVDGYDVDRLGWIAAGTVKPTGTGMSFVEALSTVVGAHTRFDDRAGFTYSQYADLMHVTQTDYGRAWETLRQALGHDTEPQR